MQANPLNTYLSSKPLFTSPQPLAASSGLTIPLQITLSEIKLSAFIILVFSRQKGLTLVFRNDPLESLKVSSTFDTIPFVRDYLQKTIDAQLRTLMMDELPAIIHRLSLQYLCPNSRAKEDMDLAQAAEKKAMEEAAIDPLATPPLDAVDAFGNALDPSEISELTLDGGSENQSLFSQRSLLRLAALTDSHRTLSLFTPSIRDTVFRAWASPGDKSDGTATPHLVRTTSSLGTGTTYTFENHSTSNGELPSRPSLTSLQSATSGLSLGSGRTRSHTGRKKKHRVVNLRRSKSTVGDGTVSESGESTTTTDSSAGFQSEPALSSSSIPEEPEDPVTPPRSPNQRVRFRSRQDSIDLGDTPRGIRNSSSQNLNERTPRPNISASSQAAIQDVMDVPPLSIEASPPKRPQLARAEKPAQEVPIPQNTQSAEKTAADPTPMWAPNRHVLEQAWMMKIANEMARRSHDTKSTGSGGFWSSHSEREYPPPPAYEAH